MHNHTAPMLLGLGTALLSDTLQEEARIRHRKGIQGGRNTQ